MMKPSITKHVLIIATVFIASMVAVPFFYTHRMSAGAWLGGMIMFVALPFIVGILQDQPNRTIAKIVGMLLLLCPTVYVATDRLDSEFEKLRDGFFLGTAVTVSFVCSAWMANSLRARHWGAILGSVAGLVFASAAVFIMLWMFIYFE